MAPEVADKQALEEELRGADAQQLYNAAQEPRDRVRVEEPRRPRVGDVVLYTIDGGGHTWPGAIAVPRLGATTQEVNATDEMWSFFVAQGSLR